MAEAGHARELVAVAGADHNDVHEVAGDQYREKFLGFLGAILGQ